MSEAALPPIQDVRELGAFAEIGGGALADRVWHRPAINVLGINGPEIATSAHVIVPKATARLSIRLAPEQHPDDALISLRRHLNDRVPWGARLELEVVLSAAGYRLAGNSRSALSARWALKQAFGRVPTEPGSGGGLPVCAYLQEVFPNTDILLTAVADVDSAIHGRDESVSLEALQRAALGEALLLARIGDEGSPAGGENVASG